MQKNHKGFGVIEGLIILVIAMGIGGAGWLAFRKDQTANESTKVTTTENNKKSTAEKYQENPAIRQGFTTYNDDEFSFQYPSDWATLDNIQGDGAFRFVSEDYSGGDNEYKVASTGYLLEADVAPGNLTGGSFEKDQMLAPEAQNAHGGSYEVITVDGQKAILSNIKPHGSYWSTTVYYQDKAYFFRLHAADDKKPEVKQLFKEILSTVNLK